MVTMKSKKKEMPEKREKALFLQRLLAFLIDAIIISVVSSMIIAPITDSKSLEELTNQSTTIMNQYLEQEIDMTTYMNQSMDISYDIAKQNGLGTIVTIIIYLLYYVVFQFYNKGKTLGKQLMNIQIVSKEGDELSLNQLLFRAFIVNSVLVDTLILLFAIFGSKDVYTGGVYVFMSIQYVVMFVSAIMIMYRKDRCGVQDLIAHTEVIRCEVKEKEMEVCES